MPTMSFRELVQTRYIERGTCLFDAKFEIHRQSGVSMSALRNAYDGTQVQPRTALTLIAWARETWDVDLGYAELTAAPTRAQRSVDWGELAKASIRRAFEQAALLDSWRYGAHYDHAEDLWHLTARHCGGVSIHAVDPDLNQALEKLRAQMVGAHGPDNDNGEPAGGEAVEG